MLQSSRILSEAMAVGLSPGVLGLNILPTEKCNLRCVYCYEQFPNVRMSSATVSSIKKLISKRERDLTHLSIGWFGGEPLLEKDIVLEVSRWAREASRLNSFSFESHITTNGVLLKREVFSELIESGVSRFQVTLDGTKTAHDKTRRSSSGLGSFDAIIENLTNMSSFRGNFRTTIRVHVHRGNVDDVQSLIDYLAKVLEGDERFALAIQRIKSYDPSHKIDLQLVNEAVRREVADYASLKFGTLRTRDPASSVHACYASLPNHFVIRANGKLQKCTVALYDERNDIGELTEDGSLSLANGKHVSVWSSGIFDGDLVKLMCPWAKIRATD